ncbi:MAG TPA: Tudor-knot domain-containing protein [Polyangiaceae bacterium]|nr:Tudor-knot domain-containing protein [Polyangiaceae bacterium]
MAESPGRGADLPGGARLSRRACASFVLLALLGTGCNRPYRVGDHVLVEWGDEQLLYPAYVIQKKGTRFRVHYDGYPARWDEDVTLERIQGLVMGPVNAPPPPRHVRLISGLDAKKREPAAPMSRYKVDDRIRVRWRGSIYRATVLQVISAEKLQVRYEGHESAWDEVIDVNRIVTSP